MRVLLDENLDWRLVRYFDADFQVTTVSRQGWKGMRNGELLDRAAVAFDAIVTMDRGIEHRQNRRNTLSVSFSSLREAIGLRTYTTAMLRVNEMLREVQPGHVIHVPAS